MTRQTAFPGIVVDSISAISGSVGMTKGFEEGLPEMITPDLIQNFIDENFRFFDSEVAKSELRYNMLVASYTKATAVAKARAFVRLKNPFSINTIKIKEAEMTNIETTRIGRKVYRIRASVRK